MAFYDFETVENKWKEKWYKNNLYEAVDFSTKPKKYILAEFPYPSGAALHTGHMMRYTVPDSYARYMRMKGYNVLFPMGWDAFGLPAENYAVKTGIHPAVTTKNAIEAMRTSLKRMGFSIDWSREISTIDPNYYKWTQWLFLKFYEHGLAERREIPVWWCKQLKTVLADEEVITNKQGNKISERGDYPVEKKNLMQWVLKIPEYADKLLEGLNEVDFPNSIKQAQINWIGRSEGAEIDFKIADAEERVRIFTTRVDTIYGATFLVISPEHPLIDQITSPDKKSVVDEYKKLAAQKSDLERTELVKDKTGVFTGAYAINPFSGEKLPIWTSDFVVMTYGTGAIMGVPAHDERDNEFAKKFGLEIIQVVAPATGEVSLPYCENGVLVNSAEYNGMTSDNARKEMTKHLAEEGIGEHKVNYKIRDWVFSRQRYWGEPFPIMYTENGQIVEEKNLPLLLPDVPDYKPTSDAISPLAKNQEWVNTTTPDSKPAKRETSTMPNWAGSCWYFIRYTDPHNDAAFADPEKMKYWLPVDKYFGGAEHTTMHLLYSRFWYKFFYDLGLVPTPEPYNWRLNGGLMLGPDGRKMSKSLGNIVDPMLVANNYGADALRLFISFIGPYEDTYPWNENGIKATFRLINTIYELRYKVEENVNNPVIKKAFHKMLRNITEMVENLKMNTAISEIMIFVNEAKKAEKIDKNVWKDFIKTIAPFAPFLAEELWSETNNITEWDKENSVHVQEWPKYDAVLITETQIIVPVQVNGKVKAEIQLDGSEDEATVKEMVLILPKISEQTAGKTIIKFIYIPRKIISVVVR